ncbi:MAG: hypothetical protein WCJ25_04265 [Candidatus Moraniibacteriota bacterium]
MFLLCSIIAIRSIGSKKNDSSTTAQLRLAQLRLSEEVTFSEIAKGENGHASVEAKVMVPDIWILKIDSYARSQVEKELYRVQRVQGYEIDGPIIADYRFGETPHYLVNLIRKKK